MGQTASTHDPRHVRIWQNLDGLSSESARLQMLDILLTGHEYIIAARRAGIYAELCSWIAATRRGEYHAWPRPSFLHQSVPISPTIQAVHRGPVARPPPTYSTPKPTPSYPSHPPKSNILATVPPPKRALDVLHESYYTLELDDGKPLTHESLRSAYKRAAVKAHPDKGGSAEAFDAVNRAFLYLEEVLNKLLPKTGADGADPRFTMKVTPETAGHMRGDYVAGSVVAASSDALRIEDAPQIALNPKKLDLGLFNKLFEENRLPDPDADGYGDWLKSKDGRNDMATGKKNLSKDTFNRVFEETARSTATSDTVSVYKPPSDLILSHGFGTMIGADRPEQYTKATGSMSDGYGLAYTDLKHAYGDGSTFSQDVIDTGYLGMAKDAPLPGRSHTLDDAKREYGSLPQAMPAEQAMAVAAFEKSREMAEAQRRQRVAARDVDAGALHDRLKGRLTIRE